MIFTLLDSINLGVIAVESRWGIMMSESEFAEY